MTNWIEHNGGPQPVREDVWVEIECDPLAYSKSGVQEAGLIEWCGVIRWRVINQDEIDAARLEGIRLGLEAAGVTLRRDEDRLESEWRAGLKADNYLQGRSDGMSEAIVLLRALDPETIACEAVLDQLTSEAQEQNMGYAND